MLKCRREGKHRGKLQNKKLKYFFENQGDVKALSCIITGGPAPILRSVNKVSAKTWRILSENDAISMTTVP